jgi:nucleoside-diphosphate-sugar epimerase
MRVFVAGATGAVGIRLVIELLADGHEVVGMVRSRGREDALRRLGAEPVVADGLDREAVIAAVALASPDVLVHEMTALAGVTSYRDFNRAFALTNRLRTEGTDNLLAAARAAGVCRVVAQSFGNWTYERRGGAVKDEADPLDPSPPAGMARSLRAIRHLEAAVVGAEGIDGVALRYGNLYGPRTSFGEGGAFVELVRRRKVPIIGGGGGVWSFVHVDDAAAATAAAVWAGAPGIYNIADDDPAPAAVWLPALAQALGARSPRRVPAWLGRLVAGEASVSMFTRIRGASNAKAKRALGWRPLYSSWRDGFRRGLADAPAGIASSARA